MTVSAQQRQVVELRFQEPRYMEGHYVVYFDVALTELAIRTAEVKGADLAPQQLAKPLYVGDLAAAELRITLTCEGPAGEEPPLQPSDAVLGYFARLLRDLGQTDRLGPLPYGGSCGRELSRALKEGGDHRLVELSAPGGFAAVSRVVCGEVGGLPANTADRPELREGAGKAAVQGQGTEQGGQLDGLRIGLPQLTPVIAGYQRAGQQQFVPSPRWAPHVQYRMGIRRVVGAVLGIWNAPHTW